MFPGSKNKKELYNKLYKSKVKMSLDNSEDSFITDKELDTEFIKTSKKIYHSSLLGINSESINKNDPVKKNDSQTEQQIEEQTEYF